MSGSPKCTTSLAASPRRPHSCLRRHTAVHRRRATTHATHHAQRRLPPRRAPHPLHTDEPCPALPRRPLTSSCRRSASRRKGRTHKACRQPCLQRAAPLGEGHQDVRRSSLSSDCTPYCSHPHHRLKSRPRMRQRTQDVAGGVCGRGARVRHVLLPPQRTRLSARQHVALRERRHIANGVHAWRRRAAEVAVHLAAAVRRRAGGQEGEIAQASRTSGHRCSRCLSLPQAEAKGRRALTLMPPRGAGASSTPGVPVKSSTLGRAPMPTTTSEAGSERVSPPTCTSTLATCACGGVRAILSSAPGCTHPGRPTAWGCTRVGARRGRRARGKLGRSLTHLPVLAVDGRDLGALEQLHALGLVRGLVEGRQLRRQWQRRRKVTGEGQRRVTRWRRSRSSGTESPSPHAQHPGRAGHDATPRWMRKRHSHACAAHLGREQALEQSVLWQHNGGGHLVAGQRGRHLGANVPAANHHGLRAVSCDARRRRAPA